MFVEHKELGEETKITKLSQAIRIGACFRPQCDGQPFFGGGSCAIGAAYEALGGAVDPELDTGAAWEMVANTLGFHPSTARYDDEGHLRELCDDIFRRNDDLKMTREEIADWLESEGY